MKRALVTGGAGFVGNWIVRTLLERGVEVRVLAKEGERLDNLDGLTVEVVRGDVLSPADARRAVADMDTVFHAAAIYDAWAPNPRMMYTVNLEGTFHMLQAAREVGATVVYTASIAALGRPEPGRVGDETLAYEAWEVDFSYSRAKYFSMRTALNYAAWGMDVRVVCPGIVFGPHDLRPTPSGGLILALLRGQARGYFEGGATYVDVRDAALAHVLAAERGKAGEIYIATGHNLDNRAFIDLAARVAGVKVPAVKIPTPVARLVLTAYEARAARTGVAPPISKTFMEYGLKPAFYSSAKAERELGATFRPLEETVADAIADFRRRGVV